MRHPFRSIFHLCLLGSTLSGLSLLHACGNTSTVATAPVASSSPMAGMHHGSKAKININSAILSELDKLEAQLGVPALSHRIQASRPYATVDELVKKQVLTPAQFDQVKELITTEDVVLTGVAKDVDYMTKLSLMKGHLLVARELLDLQKPEQAEPHIGHPVEEIYADVEDQLQERQVPEFKTALIGLQDLIKAKSLGPKTQTSFETSMKSVDAAIAALPKSQRQDPAFVLQVINGLLETANAEYSAAIANNKITAAIEYQDSRGFVVYANDLYKAIAPQVEKANPKAHQEISTSLNTLQKTWASVLPPATPVSTPDQVAQLVKTIELNTQKVIQP